MKELTVTTSNALGSLAAVAEALGSVGVNIEAISCYGLEDKAIFRVLTADVSSAVKVLSRVPTAKILESDILLIKMLNRPGELGKITRKLANKGINLENLYIVGKKENFTEVAIKPVESDVSKARDVLGVKD